MIGEIFEIGLLAGINGNTSAAAHAAAMPEFAKEADWLANQYFIKIRRKSGPIRVLFDISMLSLTVMTCVGASKSQSANVFACIVIIVIWMSISKCIKQMAINKALNQAWATIKEKQMRQNTINEMLYQAAQIRLKAIR